MEHICGCNFKENVHHGLIHASDLLSKAKILVEAIKTDQLVDWKVITIAILLHDIFAGKSELHGQAAAEFIEKNHDFFSFLSHGQIEKIQQAVAFHDRKVCVDLEQKIELNLETKVLYDVDNLDAFGIKGIYRYFCAHIVRGLFENKNAEGILAEIKAKVSDNVQRRRENLYYAQSRCMADHDFPITKMFFDKLVAETYSIGTYKGATGVFGFVWENFKLKPWEIASKVEKYNIEISEDNLEIEEVAFVKGYFKRLKDVYAKAKIQWEKNNSSLDFSVAPAMKDMLALIETVI